MFRLGFSFKSFVSFVLTSQLQEEFPLPSPCLAAPGPEELLTALLALQQFVSSGLLFYLLWEMARNYPGPLWDMWWLCLWNRASERGDASVPCPLGPFWVGMPVPMPWPGHEVLWLLSCGLSCCEETAHHGAQSLEVLRARPDPMLDNTLERKMLELKYPSFQKSLGF